MKKFTLFIENFLTPVAIWVGKNKYISAIRDAFIAFMPFIIAGSLFLIISSFPIPQVKDFFASIFGKTWWYYVEIPFSAVFPFMALFITFLVAYKLAESHKIDSISAGVIAVICLLIITPQVSNDEIGTVLPLEWIGSKGLLVGMFIAIISTEVLRFFIAHKIIIKMPEGVPQAVATSFAAIIPAIVLMFSFLIIRLLFMITNYETIHNFVYTVLATPIRLIGTSFFGAILTVIMITLLWSVGVNSGAIVNGILRPFWLDNQEANIIALKAGKELPHIVTEQFFDMIWMGGAGATLGLVIAILIKTKSKQNKVIAELSLAPGLFNINEPVLFGIPIILNPIMLIPFNLVPIILVIVQYSAMSLNLVSRPTGVVIPWTTPPIISGFLITGNISGSIIQVINLCIAVLIYLPFILFVDKDNLKNEKEGLEI